MGQTHFHWRGYFTASVRVFIGAENFLLVYAFSMAKKVAAAEESLKRVFVGG